MKPMLAATPETLTTLRYPVLASPKLDGIRCLIINGVAVSRKLIAIPNRHIAATLKGLPELDGELLVKGSFQDVTSAVMSEDGEPQFEYHVFDTFQDPKVPFRSRYAAVEEFVAAARKAGVAPWLKVVPHTEIQTARQLLAYEKKVVDAGLEGVMLRDPMGPYKFGRSTEREGWLLKVKRFVQEEATVIGFEELEGNNNTATVDNLGHTKRSHHKAGKVLRGTLGALVCRLADGREFSIGTGFTSALRDELWRERKSLAGRIVTFKWQKHGAKDAPRFPVFLGFRDPRDMS